MYIITDGTGFVAWSVAYQWSYSYSFTDAARFETEAEARSVIADHYAEAVEHGVNLYTWDISGD